jgi:hypothetical protein
MTGMSDNTAVRTTHLALRHIIYMVFLLILHFEIGIQTLVVGFVIVLC